MDHVGPYGASIKYVRLFLANFYPLPCHTWSHIPGPPKSTSHISEPPQFLVSLVQKTPNKSPLYKFSLNCSQWFLFGGVLSGGLLSGRFCPGWFLSVPQSVRIHLLRQKVRHHFKFHVSYVRYQNLCVTSHALYPPPPVTNCHTFSDPLPP